MTLKKRAKEFGLSKNGSSLLELTPGNTIDAGIVQARDWPELVPVYEEYAAMIATNYNEGEWHATTWEVRARAIAFYRLSAAKRLHENDAQVKHSKRMSKRK